MSEEIKDVNKKIDEAEAAMKKYASKDTVISIGGYEFTPAKLMVAFTLVSSTLGGLYGAFEVYKDYQSMKKRIAEYVAPDMAEFDKKLAVIQKDMDATKSSVQEATSYTNNIKNDLKSDIRRLENVVENVERNNKQTAREVDQSVKDVQQELRRTSKEIDSAVKQSQRETEQALKQLNRELDSKIQKALDNPLSK